MNGNAMRGKMAKGKMKDSTGNMYTRQVRINT